MSDNSKAKWPDSDMRIEDLIDYMRGEGLRNLNTLERRFICDTVENLQAQVKHLPRMVALLKSLGDVGDMSLPEMERAAIAILRDINELPGEGCEG